MNNKKVIEYLSAQGLEEKRIIEIMNNEEIKNEMIKLIMEYEETLSHNGFTKYDALENFKTVQRMKNLKENKRIALNK